MVRSKDPDPFVTVVVGQVDLFSVYRVYLDQGNDKYTTVIIQQGQPTERNRPWTMFDTCAPADRPKVSAFPGRLSATAVHSPCVPITIKPSKSIIIASPAGRARLRAQKATSPKAVSATSTSASFSSSSFSTWMRYDERIDAQPRLQELPPLVGS